MAVKFTRHWRQYAEGEVASFSERREAELVNNKIAVPVELKKDQKTGTTKEQKTAVTK